MVSEMIDLVLAVLFFCQVTDANIMLGKPSVQSSTLIDEFTFISTYANDGGDYVSSTAEQDNPYWQGDLQGFYSVSTIVVKSGNGRWNFGEDLRLAFMGVSIQDVNCADSEVIQCGQWPDDLLPDHTIVFNCPTTVPVRFVRIWREGYGRIAVREVTVEGVPNKIRGTTYDKDMFQKVTTPTTSLSVSGVIGCSSMCLQTQPCLAFSYSTTEQPNCLLASDVTMTSDANWNGYSVRSCSSMPSCDPDGDI